MSGRANVFEKGGYLHTERENGTACNTFYFGDLFGFLMAVRKLGDSPPQPRKG